MKKSAVCIFLFFSLSAQGQNDSCFIKHYLSLNLTELIIAAPRFSYEYRVFRNHSFYTDLGYKFRVIPFSPNVGSGLEKFDGLNPFSYQNYNISIGYKFYFNSKNKRRQDYVSLTYMHRCNYVNGSIIVGERDYDYNRFYRIFSGYMNIDEIRLQTGHRIFYFRKRKMNPDFIEICAGFGIANKFENVSLMNANKGKDMFPDFSKITYIDKNSKVTSEYEWYELRLSIGIKYGFSWGVKTVQSK